MPSQGPFTAEQLSAISQKVTLGVQAAERSMPSGMQAHVTFRHEEVNAWPTKALWDYMENIEEYVALASPTAGMEGTSVFLCSKTAMRLLAEGLHLTIHDEDGVLTPEGQEQLASLAKELAGRFAAALGDLADIPCQVPGPYEPASADGILRPLAAADSAMLRGFVMDSKVVLRLQALSVDMEGDVICIFVPEDGDLSGFVDGVLAKREKPAGESEITVLTVDDASFMRNMIKRFLENTPYTVVGEGSTGAEAIQKFKELNPDLVIMDIMMPDMGGVAAVRGIMEVDESASILMCSALASKNMVNDALSFGAKGYVVKPFKGPDLLAAIEEVLAR